MSISVLCDYHVDCLDGDDEDCGKLFPTLFSYLVQ